MIANSSLEASPSPHESYLNLTNTNLTNMTNMMKMPQVEAHPRGRNKSSEITAQMSAFTFNEDPANLHKHSSKKGVNAPVVLTTSNAFSERNFKEKELAENKEFSPDIYNLNTSDRKIVEKDLDSKEPVTQEIKEIEKIEKIEKNEKVEKIEKNEIKEVASKKKDDIFSRLDKLNLNKFSSEGNNPHINHNSNSLDFPVAATEMMHTKYATNKNSFKPVKKSVKILEIAKSLEMHLYGESDISLPVTNNATDTDATTKILLDKPVQKNKKKMSKFGISNLNLQ